MNKKNFPIFISVLVVSLFFTVVFYYSYTIIRLNNEDFKALHFYDAELEGELSTNDIDKIKSIDDIDLVGEMSIRPDSAKYKDELIAVSYQDQAVNKMRKYSDLIDGRFPEKEGEIVLSKSLVQKSNLKIGDTFQIDFGNRMIDDKVIEATSTFTDKETYQVGEQKEVKLVGVYEDIYNKYSKVNYGLALKNDNKPRKLVLKFKSFEEAYKNRAKLENEINKKLGKDITLNFDSSLVNRYEYSGNFIIADVGTILAIIGCIALFVFFVRNVFKVWILRKIRELSMYKSIGTTDLQIYLLLLKEGIFLSILPIIIGHFLGYGIILRLFKFLQENQGIGKFVSNYFSPLLSTIILFVALLIVAFSIIKPAKEISQISIIDGIRGNLDFDNNKKKRAKTLWKELMLNNLASIKSQRYISAIGIIIISALLIVMSATKYNREFSYYDDGYNVIANYYSENKKIPQVFKDIKKEIPNEKSYISRECYVEIDKNLELSQDAKNVGLDEKLEKKLKKDRTDKLSGMLIALGEEDFKNLGGEKGDFILYNMVQEDPNVPVSKAEKIPYFSNPKNINLQISDDFKKTIKISKNIEEVGIYDSRTIPFHLKIYTDFDTFFDLRDQSKDDEFNEYPYVLNLKVKNSEMENVKQYVDNKIRESISPNEVYDITTKADIEKNRNNDIESLKMVAMAMAVIIFILNVTNGYSSINLSLMSRKKEIGTLYSCGMDLDELKSAYRGEFIEEQIRSFIFAILISLGVMLVISISSYSLTMKNLLVYYDYKLFLEFSLVVYGINILIYHFSLKRILDRPTIDLIRTI